MRVTFKAVTVITTPRVDAQIKSLCENHLRADDVIDGVMFRLALDPECGLELNNGYYILQTADHEIPSIPVLDVVYRFEPDPDDGVEIVEIRQVP